MIERFEVVYMFRPQRGGKGSSTPLYGRRLVTGRSALVSLCRALVRRGRAFVASSWSCPCGTGLTYLKFRLVNTPRWHDVWYGGRWGHGADLLRELAKA